MADSKEMQTYQYDVLVIGYGSAGAVAAIEAAGAGARVLLVEKLAHLGGNSLLSAGYLRVALDANGAADYLDATNGGRVDRSLIETLAQGMTELIPYLEALARPLNANVFRNVGPDPATRDMDDLYEWPGQNSFGWAGIESIPGFDGYPWVLNGTRGENLLRVLEVNVDAAGVEVWFETAAERLIVEDGAVAGAVLRRGDETVAVRAAGGVILACGGFEFDAAMLRDYLEVPAIYAIGCSGNTGDGIRMAQQVGASLWHMWHIHGSYGFKFDGMPMAIRNHLGGVRRPQRKVAWILVDQDGRRFMNEVPPAPQDTPVRPLAHLDTERGRFNRVPAWMIFDEEARRLGPVGKTTAAVPQHWYEWSEDNSAEIAKGWILQADSLDELAEKTGLPAAMLAQTVAAWNGYVTRQSDDEFGRLPGTMTPVATPPYYAAQIWPIVTNTQGGPQHDAAQRVLTASGEPVPGLYAVGELGSIFGHIYLLGGNLAECIVGGRIAGRQAAQSAGRVAPTPVHSSEQGR
jgi:succinate dehydrogenase/fumarate reductase flavoprotein subunit